MAVFPLPHTHATQPTHTRSLHLRAPAVSATWLAWRCCNPRTLCTFVRGLAFQELTNLPFSQARILPSKKPELRRQLHPKPADVSRDDSDVSVHDVVTEDVDEFLKVEEEVRAAEKAVAEVVEESPLREESPVVVHADLSALSDFSYSSRSEHSIEVEQAGSYVEQSSSWHQPVHKRSPTNYPLAPIKEDGKRGYTAAARLVALGFAPC